MDPLASIPFLEFYKFGNCVYSTRAQVNVELIYMHHITTPFDLTTGSPIRSAPFALQFCPVVTSQTVVWWVTSIVLVMAGHYWAPRCLIVTGNLALLGEDFYNTGSVTWVMHDPTKLYSSGTARS